MVLFPPYHGVTAVSIRMSVESVDMGVSSVGDSISSLFGVAALVSIRMSLSMESVVLGVSSVGEVSGGVIFCSCGLSSLCELVLFSSSCLGFFEACCNVSSSSWSIRCVWSGEEVSGGGEGGREGRSGTGGEAGREVEAGEGGKYFSMSE